MSTPGWVTELFQTIDNQDTVAFVRFIEDDGEFRFGNAPAAIGSTAIHEAVGGFFASIGGLSHELIGVWEHPGATVVEGKVTYTRLDGSHITLPFANVMHLGESGRIAAYRVFADVTPLYQPPTES